LTFRTAGSPIRNQPMTYFIEIPKPPGSVCRYVNNRIVN